MKPETVELATCETLFLSLTMKKRSAFSLVWSIHSQHDHTSKKKMTWFEQKISIHIIMFFF